MEPGNFAENKKASVAQFIPVVLALTFSTFGWGQSGTVKNNNTAEGNYTNPISVSIGDPFVLKVADGYYLYGTGGGVSDGYATWFSPDLVNWQFKGQVFKGNSEDSWSNGSFWAPSVYKYNNKYYMFYSAQWKDNPRNELENFRIGVAVAETPEGPFKDLLNRPVFDPGYPVIDADVLFDKSGRIYLYFSRCCYKHPVKSEISDWALKKGWYKEIEESWVYGIELKPGFTGTTGDPVLLLRPPVSMSDTQSEWESRSVTSHEVNRRWTEGSFILEHNDLYYLMYSANYFGGENYAIGYATSKSPLGPFIKAPNNPVLQKNNTNGGAVSGTGHNSVTFSPDGKIMYCVYHGRTAATGNRRMVFIDRMEIKVDGSLIIYGPTTTPQPLPAGRK